MSILHGRRGFALVAVAAALVLVAVGACALAPQAGQVSEKLRTKTHSCTPTQIHLALTGDPTEMRVSWKTKGKHCETYCDTTVFASRRDADGKGVSVVSRSARSEASEGDQDSYSSADMCAAPARHASFRPPKLHSVVLSELSPGEEFEFQLPGQNAALRAQAAPPVGPEETLRFVAFGDMGEPEHKSAKSPGAGLTSAAVRDEVAAGRCDLVLHLGDIAYADGVPHVWETFMAMIEPVSSRVPWMVAIGNHEYDWSAKAKGPKGGDGDASGASKPYDPSWGNFGNDSGGECGVAAAKRFLMPQAGGAGGYHAFAAADLVRAAALVNGSLAAQVAAALGAPNGARAGSAVLRAAASASWDAARALAAERPDAAALASADASRGASDPLAAPGSLGGARPFTRALLSAEEDLSGDLSDAELDPSSDLPGLPRPTCYLDNPTLRRLPGAPRAARPLPPCAAGLADGGAPGGAGAPPVALRALAGANSPFWFAFSAGPVRFLTLSTEHNVSPGSEQAAWLHAELASVDRCATPWLVVIQHRPQYTPFPHRSNRLVGRHLQANLEAVFESYEVDLVLSGHVHAYARSCNVLKGKCIPREDGGAMHLMIGTGGRKLSGLAKNQAGWFAAGEERWGYVRGRVDSSSLALEFVSSENGKVYDSIELSNERAALRACRFAASAASNAEALFPAASA